MLAEKGNFCFVHIVILNGNIQRYYFFSQKTFLNKMFYIGTKSYFKAFKISSSVTDDK